ncbi:hypothetical protein [Rummeliibacillus suwonensis]|uniref:hypothetical protein n=1 Tax=Rummeliibacillus suwonensis TaxID=1306154 RepID=UPI00289E57F1|nr:hypothetical protein [Rummeliibacillus suwonensis]
MINQYFYFGPTQQIMEELLNSKKIIIPNKLYHAKARNKGLLVDVQKGRVFVYFLKKHELIISKETNSILLRGISSSNSTKVYDIEKQVYYSQIGIQEVGVDVSYNAEQPVISFDNSNTQYWNYTSIRKRTLIYGMEYGEKVFKAMGSYDRRTHEIHYKDYYSENRDKATNLILVTRKKYPSQK